MSYLLDKQSGEKSFLFGQGGGSITAKNLETVFLGEIPLDEEIRQGSDHGIPVILGNPSPSSEAYLGIAEELLSILPAIN